MVLSQTGLTVDCIEAGQQAVYSYVSVSHEALTQHVTFSNTTALQPSPRNRTKHAHKRDKSLWGDNHCPDPLSYLIFISEGR